MSDQPRTGVEAIAIGLDDLVDDLNRGDAAPEKPATPHALMVVALGAFLDSIGRLSEDEVAILFTDVDEFAELYAVDYPQVAAVYRRLATIYGLSGLQRREHATAAETRAAVEAMGAAERAIHRLPVPSDAEET